MKTATLWLGLLCGAQAGLGLLPLVAQAADTQNPGPPVFLAAPPDSTPDKAAPTGGKANTEEVKKLLKTMALSPGLDEIVKLKKAGVEDAVILSFIQSSPIAYRPGAQEILELRDSGVSTPIITAMLQHGGELRQRAAETAAQTQPAPPAPAATTPAAVPEPTPVQAPPAYYATPTVYPVSSPTVIYTGYPSYGYGYGGCYPGYYSGYPRLGLYGGFYPSLSLGFRFGGGHFGGYYGARFGGYGGHFHHR